MNTMSMVKQSVRTFLVESDYIICNFLNKYEGFISKYYGVMLNILFSLILSIPIGFFAMLLEFVICNFLKIEILLNQKNPYLYMFLPSSVLVLLFLTSFIILNLDRKKDLSLPFVIYFIVKLLLKIRFLIELFKSILFLFFITITTVLCLAFILDTVKIPFSKITPILGSVLLISFLLSISFYSQMTLNLYNRQLRQFTMFFIIFIFSTFWGFYQFIFYLGGQMDKSNILNIAVLVFSLVGSMPTVLDKGRDFLESLKTKHRVEIRQDWEKCIMERNEERNDLKNKFLRLTEGMLEIKIAWQKGKKEKIILITFILICLPTVFIISTYGPAVMDKLQKIIVESFRWLESELLTIPIVQENKTIIFGVIFLLLAIGYAIWHFIILLKLYSVLTWYGRVLTLTRVLFAMLFIPPFICMLFPSLPRQLIHICIPFFLILTIISLTFKQLEKKYKSELDYYKIGSIYFNHGHYQEAYENFKLSSEIGVRKEECLLLMEECKK